MQTHTPADLLVEARWVLPVEPRGVTLDDAAVVVSGGRILAVGEKRQLATRYVPRETVSRPHHLLMPSFVNAHGHAARTLFRSLPVRGPLFAWLRDVLWPAEERWMSPDLVRDGTRLAVAEMLAAGITAFADTCLFPEEAARVAGSARVRAAIGLPITDTATLWAADAADSFERAEQLWDQYRADPWVSLHFAPHATWSISDETLSRVQRVADELDARIAMHVHETETEVRDSLAQHGVRPLQRLSDRGLLRPGFCAVHMNRVDDEDLELAARTGISVIACPQSNRRFGNGQTPLADLLQRGVPTGLGTDGAPACGALDILAEARLASLLAGIDAHAALQMATLGGAFALGLAQEIGSLVPGKAADFICIDLGTPEVQPIGDPADAALYAATRHHVSDVWIAGRAVVASGQPLAFDADELRELAARWQRRMLLESAA